MVRRGVGCGEEGCMGGVGCGLLFGKHWDGGRVADSVNCCAFLQECDEPVLEHLTDIKVAYADTKGLVS